MHTPDPTRLLIDGKPWWLFADGTRLPVISGGAGEGEGGDGDEGGDGGGGGGEEGDDDLGDEFDADRAKAAIAKRNQENKSLRQRLKEAEKAQAELDELKKSQLTKEEQLTASNKELEEKVGTTEARALRLEVALEAAPDWMKPADVAKYAKRLSGASKEELEKDAEEFFADLPEPQEGGGGSRSRRPQERLRGGGDPTEEPDENDPRKLASRVPRF